MSAERTDENVVEDLTVTADFVSTWAVEPVARLRRMIAEPGTGTYSDSSLQACIERFPTPDARGVEPWDWDYSTTPPTQAVNDEWVPTYDLNRCAAEIWDEKSAAVACDFSFSADGTSYSRQQVVAQYHKTASLYRSKSSPLTMTLARVQREVGPSGYIVEVTPIIDRISDEDAHN